MMVTFTPLGVPSEYSCIGCLPRGKSLSCVAPAMGRLILAKRPPLAWSQVQTFGGTYGFVAVVSVMENLRQAKVKPSWLKGVLRARTPLAAAIALASAGVIGA